MYFAAPVNGPLTRAHPPLTEHSSESFIGMKYMQIFVRSFTFFLMGCCVNLVFINVMKVLKEKYIYNFYKRIVY